jgi:hypothetical protein
MCRTAVSPFHLDRDIEQVSTQVYTSRLDEDFMAKFTRFILFSLTPELYVRVCKEALQQKMSLGQFVRTALSQYLISLKPTIVWTPDEQKYADERMRLFRHDDR